MPKFEWDDAKAAGNERKHGVSFDAASTVFLDAFAVEEEDEVGPGEEQRWLVIGMAEGDMLSVVYVERSDRFRIISARRATKHEQILYFLQNAQRP